MKDYTNKHDVQLFNNSLLFILSLVLGVILGIVSFFISQIIYIPLVFPILIALLSLKCFDKVTDYIKIPNKYFNSICAFVMVLTLIYFSHYVKYINTRNIYINDVQIQKGVSHQYASQYIDWLFNDITGFKGFIGFELYKAKIGEVHTVTILTSGIIGQSLHYTLKGITFWVYYVLEAVILIYMCTTMNNRNKIFYNADERLWYQRFPKLLGTVALKNYETFLQNLKDDKIKEAAILINTPKDVLHPICEINVYTLMNNSKNFVLLELLKTQRIRTDFVKRTTVYRGEMTHNEFESFTQYLSRS